MPFGQSSGFGKGEDIYAGGDDEERDEVFGLVGDIYVTVEGEGEVSQIAKAAEARGAKIVPLKRTGGASDGELGFPKAALKKPSYATEDQWDLLANKDAPVEDSAEAAVDVVLGASDETPAEASQRLRSAWGSDTTVVCIVGEPVTRRRLGGRRLDSEMLTLVKDMAPQLVEDMGSKAVFATQGMSGVQETFANNAGDGSHVKNIMPFGQSSGFGKGDDINVGRDTKERDEVFDLVGDFYATVGGDGVVVEASSPEESLPWWFLVLLAILILILCLFCLKLMFPTPPPAPVPPAPVLVPAPKHRRVKGPVQPKVGSSSPPADAGCRDPHLTVSFQDAESNRFSKIWYDRPLGLTFIKDKDSDGTTKTTKRVKVVKGSQADKFGIKNGAEVTAIDFTGQDRMSVEDKDFPETYALLRQGVDKLPHEEDRPYLELTFLDPSTKLELVKTWYTKPLGLNFFASSPIKVNEVDEGTRAWELGVMKGMEIKKVAHTEKPDPVDVYATKYDEVMKVIEEGMERLPSTEKGMKCLPGTEKGMESLPRTEKGTKWWPCSVL